MKCTMQFLRYWAASLLLVHLFGAGTTWAQVPERDGFRPFGTVFGPLVGATIGGSWTDAEPIYATGGEFRERWPLLSLGGPLPLEFSLLYAPDIQYRSAMNDGRVQFPPSLNNRAFTTNTVYRFVEFEDRNQPGNPVFANVFLADDAFVLKAQSPGVFTAMDPVGYELKRSGDSYFFLDAARGRVLVFRSRPTNWDVNVPGGPHYFVRRCGEAEYVFDRNYNYLAFSYNADNNPVRIEDGFGRRLDLTYLTGGYYDRHLAAVTDDAGRMVQFQFQQLACNGEAEDVLESFTDPLGRQTRFEYFAPAATPDCNLVQRIIRPLGNSHVDQTWADNPVGVEAVVSQRDAFGNLTTVAFTKDRTGNLGTTFTFPDGSTRSFVHVDQRYPLTSTDEAGWKLTVGYNDQNQLTSAIDTLGQITMVSPLPGGQPASITNPLGQATHFTYETRVQAFAHPDKAEAVDFTFRDLVRIDYPDSTVETFAYDDRGNLVTRTDPAGRNWSYTYTPAGQLLTAVNPSGGAHSYAYHPDATLASESDSESGVTHYEYDLSRRLARIVHPDGTWFEITRDLASQITAISDEKGAVTRFDRDANGNLVKITDPAGGEITSTYDAMDRRTSVTNRLGDTVTFGYDPLGQLTGVTQADGRLSHAAFDPRRRPVSLNTAGSVWTATWDDESRLNGVTAPGEARHSFQLDAWGRPVSLADPLGRVTNLVYDAAGRLASFTDPMGRPTVLGYEPRGLLVSVEGPGNLQAHLAYNESGLPVSVSGAKSGAWTFVWSPLGRLLAAGDPLDRPTLFEYDNRGRPVTISYPGGDSQILDYDPAGRLIQRHYSTGLDLTYTYDLLGRLASADGTSLGRDAEGRVISVTRDGQTLTATYDSGGRLVTLGYPGGLTVSYAYDTATGLLKRVSDNQSSAWVELGYDSGLRPASWMRSNGIVGTWERDAAGQPVRIREGNFMDLAYVYDAAGRVVQVSGTPVLEAFDSLAAALTGWTYDAACQHTSAGYAYDPRGRQSAGPGHTFSWDGASRLTGIDGAGLAWDGLGRLAGISANGQTLTCLAHPALPGAPVAAERSGEGRWTANVWLPSGELLYRLEPAGESAWQVTFYHFDRTGHVLALSDAVGTVTGAYAYDPFGAMVSRWGNSRQPFTGLGRWGVRQVGQGDCLYLTQARPYDPAAGRFLTPDPTGFIPEEPRSLNPYQFAFGSPVTLIDRNGLDPDYPDSTALTDLGLLGPFTDALTDVERLVHQAGEEIDDTIMFINDLRLMLSLQGSDFDRGAYSGSFVSVERELPEKERASLRAKFLADISRLTDRLSRINQRLDFLNAVRAKLWRDHGKSTRCLFNQYQAQQKAKGAKALREEAKQAGLKAKAILGTPFGSPFRYHMYAKQAERLSALAEELERK